MPRVPVALAMFVTIGSAAACGSPAAPSTAPTHTASPTPTAAPHPLEFAVLLLGNESSPNTISADVLTIFDATGQAHGRASFQPPVPPSVGNAAALLQPDALTAAGAAYYADSQGAIWQLAPDRSPPTQPAWRVNLNASTGSQPLDELSFAVSPDGRRLVAQVLAFPPPQTNCQGPCGLTSNQVKRTIWDLAPGFTGSSQTPPVDITAGNVPRMFGWVSSGPVQLDDTPMGTQDGTPGYDAGPFGHAHVLNASDGSLGEAIGSAACRLMDAPLADGTAVCASATAQSTSNQGPFRVLGLSAGTSGYQVGPTIVGCAGCQLDSVGWVRLSPDGRQVAMSLQVSGTGGAALPALAEVVTSTGSITPLPQNFAPLGGLDGSTLIGAEIGASNSCPPGIPPANLPLAIVRLGGAGSAVPLNACGLFAGVVRPAA